VTQYNSYSTHYRETDCLREMVEPFMYNAGVDIILHGAAITTVGLSRMRSSLRETCIQIVNP
jgi:hypothetical protein